MADSAGAGGHECMHMQRTSSTCRCSMGWN